MALTEAELEQLWGGEERKRPQIPEGYGVDAEIAEEAIVPKQGRTIIETEKMPTIDEKTSIDDEKRENAISARLKEMEEQKQSFIKEQNDNSYTINYEKPEDKEELYGGLRTISESVATAPFRPILSPKETIEDIKEGVAGLAKNVKERGADFARRYREMLSGDMLKGGQSAAAAPVIFAGTLADIMWATTITTGKILSTEKAEQLVKEKLGDVVGGVSSSKLGGFISELWNDIPKEAQQNLKDIGTIGELGTEVAGGGAIMGVAKSLEKWIPDISKTSKKAIDIAPDKELERAGILGEITGKGAKLRQKQVETLTKKARDEGVLGKELKKGVVSQKVQLKKDLGERKAIDKTKMSLDVSKAGFAKTAVQKDIMETFLDSTDELVDRADIARTAKRLSEKTPSGGGSYKAASKMRRKLIESTSKAYAALNDTYANFSNAINVLDTNAFLNSKSIAKANRLPKELLKRIDNVKDDVAKKDLMNNLMNERSKIGQSMDDEILRLEGQTMDGDILRDGLTKELKSQNVSIKTETRPVRQVRRTIDEIINEFKDDPEVVTFLKDKKTLEKLNPKQIDAELAGMIQNKQGAYSEKKVFELLSQTTEETKEAGKRLKELLPKKLVDDIIKNRPITHASKRVIRRLIESLVLIGATSYVVGR